MTKILLACLTGVGALLLTACAPMPPAQWGAGLDGGGYPTEVCDAAHAGRAAACSFSGAGQRQAIRANLISAGRLYIGGTLIRDPR